MPIDPVTHLEKSVAGIVEPATHLEKVIAEYGGGGGGGDVTVDDALSGSSINPVQNKVIKNALDARYTKTEADAAVDAAITEAISGVTSFEYYLCGEGEYDAQTGEPTVANPDNTHIYLTPTSGDNLYMYAYINSDFVFLGTTEIDMDGYITDTDLATALGSYYTKTEANTLLAAKQDASAAFSGDYNDLTNKPTIPTVPTNVSAFTNDAGYLTQHQDISGKANTTDLKAVAFSGAYSDLTGKPSLSTVATSGSYNDLTNKPTIPTVPSNIVKGKVSGTNTELTINIIASGTPASGTPDTTITIVKG